MSQNIRIVSFIYHVILVSLRIYETQELIIIFTKLLLFNYNYYYFCYRSHCCFPHRHFTRNSIQTIWQCLINGTHKKYCLYISSKLFIFVSMLSPRISICISKFITDPEPFLEQGFSLKMLPNYLCYIWTRFLNWCRQNLHTMQIRLLRILLKSQKKGDEKAAAKVG